MAMTQLPQIAAVKGGKFCCADTFDTFRVKVFVPDCELPADIINYGFEAPYLLVFEESERSPEEAVAWAKESGLAQIARRYAGSVVFVYPKAADGWAGADVTLFQVLMANS